jgi:hypothetical protein
VGKFKALGVGFHSLRKRLDTTTPGGMSVALAELRR